LKRSGGKDISAYQKLGRGSDLGRSARRVDLGARRRKQGGGRPQAKKEHASLPLSRILFLAPVLQRGIEPQGTATLLTLLLRFLACGNGAARRWSYRLHPPPCTVECSQQEWRSFSRFHSKTPTHRFLGRAPPSHLASHQMRMSMGT
jgi:hypothetical protein